MLAGCFPETNPFSSAADEVDNERALRLPQDLNSPVSFGEIVAEKSDELRN